MSTHWRQTRRAPPTLPAAPTRWRRQDKVCHIGGGVAYESERCDDFVTCTGYGSGERVCGWNCRHNFHPVWPRISKRNYSPEKLAELSAKNIEYNGRRYSQYEIDQMRRELERLVRAYKKPFLAEDTARVNMERTAIKLTGTQRQLAQFVSDTGGLGLSNLATCLCRPVVFSCLFL